MVANLIGPGTPSLSSPIKGPVRTPSASWLIGPTLMKQAKQVFQYGGREEPRQGEEGVAAKRVYGGETMRRLRSVRASVCVCVCVCS